MKEIRRLLNIRDDLRTNCPWDKKQTIQSLRHLTIEEVYELSESIQNQNYDESTDSPLEAAKRGKDTSMWMTIQSLKNLTIEEVYELTEAVETGNFKNLKEELGDLLLHIVF